MSQVNQTKQDRVHSTSGLEKFPSLYQAAILDLLNGAKGWRIWMIMAWNEQRQRYRRSWLGVSWITLSFALLVAVKVFIFGALSTRELSFFAPYLAIGYLVFRLISNFVTQGASVFITAQSWIKSEPLPLSIYLYKLMGSTFIQFGYMAIPTLIVCLYTNHFHAVTLLFLPFILLIYALNGLWVSAIMGIVCARYRDIKYFVATIMMVLYFMTPVLWVPPESGIRAIVANFNPLTHYVEILRSPVMNGTIPWNSVLVVAVGTVLGILTSLFIFAKTRKKIVFWL